MIASKNIGMVHKLRISKVREVPRWEIFMEQELRVGLTQNNTGPLRVKGRKVRPKTHTHTKLEAPLSVLEK